MTESSARAGREPWVLVASVVVLAIATAWGARLTEGRRTLAAATAAIQRGDRVEAVVLARAAAEARCPFCSAPDVACGLLDAIAKDAEAHGDDATAVSAWRAIRSATLATSVFGGGSARRQLADSEIARLEHRIDVAAAAGGSVPPRSEERLRDDLATTTLPSGGVFALVAAGAAMLFVGAAGFIRAKTFRASALVLAVGGGVLAAVGLLLF